jgi:peptide/nickel transport system substrate-binding protein
LENLFRAADGDGVIQAPLGRRLVPLLACSFLIAFLAGCRARTLNNSSTVDFLIESFPVNLDPRIGTDAQSEHLDSLIFSSLVACDARMNIVPDLAERWEMPDPLTYIFHLHPGVKFQDGHPLTSADVKFTFDSIRSIELKSPKRGAYLSVQSIEAPDAATVVFHLSQPYASFLVNLGRQGVGIVPSGSGADVARHPVGTGPFRVISIVPDEEIVMERNSGYFGGAPKLEKVRFRIVPDAIVRALELRKGTADIGGINSLTPDMVQALAKQPRLVAEQQPGTVIAYVAFNFDDPVLSHREVRQALAYATDRASLIKYLLHGEAHPAVSLLPPGNWAFDAGVQRYDYDPVRAEQLLDAAGFPRRADVARIHLTLKTSTDDSARLLAEALADQWKRVGVALDLRSLETATFLSDIEHGSFQLYTFRWLGANNDPDIFDYVFNSKRTPPDGANRGDYRNPALDALIDRQRIEMDRDKRKVFLAQIQQIVATDEPYLNLWFYDNVCVHTARIANIVIPASGDYDFLTAAALQ